jgi:acyl carrier protein
VKNEAREAEPRQVSCPSCGHAALPEFSQPAGVALCPRCGLLLRRSRDGLVPVGFSTEAVTNLVASRMLARAPDRERIESRIRDLVATHLGVNRADIEADTHFINDLGADSLDVVELVMAIEEEFGVTIDVN